MYFGETVTSLASEVDSGEILTFIVQTSTAISSIDDKLTLFETFDAFNTVANNKGLTKTLAFINDVLAATGHTRFYVYSVKTDTSAGFQAAVNSSSALKECQKFIYLEETASAQANPITAKISALNTACTNCYQFGAFRTAYVIPYATITAAVTAASSTPAETTVVSTFTTMLSGDGSGRIIMILPDGYSAMMSTIINVGIEQDAGRPVVTGNPGTLTYTFTREQMITLQNLGVIFIRPDRVNGTMEYHINLGVTTSFKNSSADGLLISRLTADELLRQVDLAVRPFILDRENDANIVFVQSAVDAVVADFIEEGYVTSTTGLTVSDAGNSTFAINGIITTTKSLIAIEVNTKIA